MVKRFEKVTPLWSVSFRKGKSFQGGFGTLTAAKKFAKTRTGSIVHKSVLAYV